MKLQHLQKWEQTRQMGPWKYALIYGSIWALFVVAFVFVVNSFVKFDERLFTFSGLVFALAIYWVTGIVLYRFIIWRAKEKVYQQWKNQIQN